MKIKNIFLSIIILFSANVLISQEKNEGRYGVAQPHIIIQNNQINNIKKEIPQVKDYDFPPKDQVIADDLIVTGSLAVGFDAINGESFGFNTIILKENNLRIRFEDTSNDTLGFPSVDWTLIANETSSGGQNYFAIEDGSTSRLVFKVMAGAPVDALYIASSTGNIGLGTSNPYAEIHIKDNDTPCIRMEQDSTGGWTPQTWDIVGNEANFFIRDFTNGSLLPFRIQPGAPTNSIFINNIGNVGFGTSYPIAKVDIKGSARVDSSIIISPRPIIPVSPQIGEIILDSADNILKYFDGSAWISMGNTDNQNLTNATLTGSILEIEIENGDSVTVDLQPLIADLENRVTALENALGLKDVSYTSTRLFQNFPNPFTTQTNIPMFIPNEVSEAKLIIYNVKGVEIVSYNISQRGHFGFVLKDEDIETGTYFYSLIIDGKELESKILIKTE